MDLLHGFRVPPADSSVQVPPPTTMIPRSPASIATSILRGVLIGVVLDNILVPWCRVPFPFTIVASGTYDPQYRLVVGGCNRAILHLLPKVQKASKTIPSVHFSWLTKIWNSDAIKIKLLVYTCVILNVTHTALGSYNGYSYALSAFGMRSTKQQELDMLPHSIFRKPDTSP